MAPHIPAALCELVRQRARGCCEYCRFPEQLGWTAFCFDHIVPRFQQGTTTAENLCYVCTECNSAKHFRTTARDPRTGRIVPLFNPRTQDWFRHFDVSRDGGEIIGRTAVGRATVEALQMNDPHFVRLRQLFARLGFRVTDDWNEDYRPRPSK